MESQHHQSTFGGVLTVTGDEESLDMYHGNIRLTSSSTMGAEKYHHNQHSGSVVLIHSSH